MRRLGVATAVLAPLLIGCNDHAGLLVAKQITQRSELVGGPVAVADIGDFLLESDTLRVNILGPRDSPGPGVYGGSIVDFDLRRDRIGDLDAQGHDRFAEMFPVANLLVPDPAATQVTVLEDGSNGAEAAIRVEGEGAFLFEALAILHTDKTLLDALFSTTKSSLHFRTDYIVRPGERHVDVKTTIIDTNPLPMTCTAPACPSTCPGAQKVDDKGCLTCECDDPLVLPTFSAPSSVFGGILGDAANDPNKKLKAGMIAGDFVFFGNQNDVFAPGFGFDEEKAVGDAFNVGRNTFVQPLTLDYVAASGGDVSYGYVNLPAARGAPESVVNVPLITSAATAFLAAGKNCLFDASDDVDCDRKRSWSYERFLLIGDGDIASVAEEVFRIRQTPTGVIDGVVSWGSTGQPVPKAQVLLFRDPDPSVDFTGIDQVAEANLRASGDVGLLNEIDADLGLDPVLDGDFKASVAAGTYLVVAQNAAGTALSRVNRVNVTAGQETIVDPMLPTPATIEYRFSTDDGSLTPCKLSLVALDANGNPFERDGRRRVYTGGSRFAAGVRQIELTTTGEGQIEVEPGRYRLFASRGPEFSVAAEPDFSIASGEVRAVAGIIHHEVDTSGWMSADMHLHSKPSFDSGMPLPRRVATIAAEGVELAIPTDHDNETDYRPTLLEQGLLPYIQTAVSAETTTLESGHFIAFPQSYDQTNDTTHGSHDWTCQSGDEIMAGLRANAEPGHDQLLIVPHPRDGFFGYIDQLGVDPLDMTRKAGLLEASNPVFQTAGCGFDAMEVINGKRLDLMRTGTVQELADYNRCRARVDASMDVPSLAAACPELGAGLIAPCSDTERFQVCRDRNRTALAWAMMKRILTRTPEEQDANWDFDQKVGPGEALCDLKQLGDKPVPPANANKPCSFHIGQVDDYFRYLEHGFIKTMVASSDSHDLHIEPGSPRTYFATTAETAPALSVDDAVASLKAGHALATYGPFIRASIGGKTFGETAPAPAGGKVDMALHIETASWFGVDRVEVYENGRLVRVLTPELGPSAVVDVDQAVTLDVPKRDSWVVIIAMGLEDRNLLRPMSLDIQFGEIQLSRVAATAFADIPALASVFPLTPAMPDFFPIPPYAVTNAIFLDTDGNGRYDAPLPYPEFCSVPCDPAAAKCPGDQKCVPEKNLCGYVIDGKCEHRRSAFGFDH